MNPNAEDDHKRPRDPIETAALYVILLVIAVIALGPLRMHDGDPVVLDAGRNEAAASQQRDDAPPVVATREFSTPAKAF
ncbi:MAG: hypothetical protein ABI585_13410 [Betaproteobacteria bacterium]